MGLAAKGANLAMPIKPGKWFLATMANSLNKSFTRPLGVSHGHMIGQLLDLNAQQSISLAPLTDQ